jgi:hypothetical protein
MPAVGGPLVGLNSACPMALAVGSQLIWTPEAVFSQNHSPPAG